MARVDFPCQGTLRLTRARIGFALLDQSLDFGLRQERERLKQAFHLHVGSIEPELVELVWAEHGRVKPYGVAFGLAELFALRVGDDRAGKYVHIHATHLMNQVKAGSEVTPLVGATDLQYAMIFVEQVQEVVALQHLIAEFGEGDAFLGVQSTGYGVLGEHR